MDNARNRCGVRCNVIRRLTTIEMEEQRLVTHWIQPLFSGHVKKSVIRKRISNLSVEGDAKKNIPTADVAKWKRL